MRTRLLALLVLVLAALLGWLAFPRDAAPKAESERPLEATKEAPHASTAGVEREAVAIAETTTSSAPTALLEVRGTVVDPDGLGLADLRVRENAEDSEGVRSGPGGAFSIRVASEEWTLAVEQEGWTTLRPASSDDPAGPAAARIVAAPSTAVDGRVQERDGTPLPGARLEFARDGASWTASAGFEGRFHADELPAVKGVRATASLAGWHPSERTLDLPVVGEVVFVLDREDPDAPVIEGDVVHGDGSPAKNVLVSFGAARTRTDAKGAFRLVRGWCSGPTPLVAIERGRSPAVIENYGYYFVVGPPAKSRPRLELGGSDRVLEGRLLDARGAACKGFEVHLLDATPLDPGGLSRDVAEVEAGGSLRERTDAQGRFRFAGLRDKNYSILIAGTRGANREISFRQEGLAPGPGVEVRLPERTPGSPIRGSVLTLAGVPVGGARVAFGRPVPHGSPGEFGRRGGVLATTAPDGRFEIAEAPEGFVVLVVSCDGFLPARADLVPNSTASDARRNGLEVRLRTWREIHVDASRASPLPDTAQALDASGNGLPFWQGKAASLAALNLAPLRDGFGGPIGASEDTISIALLRGGRELARIPVPPGPGAIELVWP